MNKQQLAAKIWESANKLRSKIDANEYKDYILGFIFYRYLSENEVQWLKENDFEEEDIKALVEDDIETVEYIQQNIGYFISYENLYSTWIEKGRDFNAADVTDAISSFSRFISPTHKKVFENIFQTLETGLSKLGETSGARTKAISELLYLIKTIPMDDKQGYDILGYIYEYLISKFASNAGKKAGEFYTPHEVSVVMSEIVANHLRNKEEIKIYDPTSGSGSLLINIGKSVAKYLTDGNNIKYYAQELKENTYNLTRMNLVMRGIKPDNIVTRNGDTLEDDWPYFEENDQANTYDPLYVDAVVSNPPYSQAWDPANKENDPRFSGFGLAPKAKADYAFLLHDLYHLRPDGIMTIVLPHGVLFRGGEEGEIRKNLIENNHIDSIIGLPANIFYGTGIPTIVMVLKQKRENDDVLIIDASKGFTKEGKNNKLRASDIKKIVDTVVKREGVEKYSKVVTKNEIRANEYNLNIPRYVDSSEEAESWDIYATLFGGIPQSELKSLNSYWKAFPALKNDLFDDVNAPYVNVTVGNVKDFIKSHNDITSYEEQFKNAFDGFDSKLNNELISNVMNVEVAKEENNISEDIFARLTDIALVDKYEAYQLLDDIWNDIAADIEVIQTEGFEATKVVEPNMIIKKKDGKEHEVQDGHIGKIIPFELIQKTLLKVEADKLKDKENRLSEIPSEYEEVAETLTEDEKEGEFFNEDSFVNKEVQKTLKELKKDKSEDAVILAEKLSKVDKLIKEEKALKSDIKKETAELHQLTKLTIEQLTDEQVKKLLYKKWIENLVANLYKLPETIIYNLCNKLDALSKKYESTLTDIEKEIAETEKELCGMIDQLCGDEYTMKGLNELKSLLLGM